MVTIKLAKSFKSVEVGLLMKILGVRWPEQASSYIRGYIDTPCIAAVTQAFRNEQWEVITKPIVRCQKDTGRWEPDRWQTGRLGLIIAAVRLRDGCAHDVLNESNEAGKHDVESRACEELLGVDAVHPWAVRDLRQQHRCGELSARKLLGRAPTASKARANTSE